MVQGWRAVAVDCGLGLAAVVVGALGLAGPPPAALVLVGAGAVGQAVATYALEQVAVWDRIVEHRPESLGVAFVLTLGVALALVIGGTVVTAPVAAILLGMGIGLVCYRGTFGVARPLPARRQEQLERLGW